MLTVVEATLGTLDWMRSERIWPNGSRYLWTDGFGVVLLVSLSEEVTGRSISGFSGMGGGGGRASARAAPRYPHR
jgi:hypothetical protein